MEFGHKSRHFPASLFLLLYCCSWSESLSCKSASTAVASLVLTMTPPAAMSLPFGVPFRYQPRRGRDDMESSPEDEPAEEPKPPRTKLYYKFAAQVLDWVFNELDDSEEAFPVTLDPVHPILSSEEEEVEDSAEAESSKLEKVAKATEKQNSKKNAKSRSRRIGDTKKSSKRKNKVSKKDVAMYKLRPLVEYDDTLEKASLPELKQMYHQMKKEDEGFFNFKFLTSGLSSSVLRFGRNMFRRVYCGWSGYNSYCNPNNHDGPASMLFDEVQYPNRIKY